MIKAVKDINVRVSDIRITDVFHIYGNKCSTLCNGINIKGCVNSR